MNGTCIVQKSKTQQCATQSVVEAELVIVFGVYGAESEQANDPLNDSKGGKASGRD